MGFDYRKWYTTRRNGLCNEHHSTFPKGNCNECRNLSKGKPQIYLAQFESDDRLDNAAYLEYQVAMCKLTLREARYKLVEQYPETNCIPTTYDRTDISIVSLIRPFYTTVRSLTDKGKDNGQQVEQVFESSTKESNQTDTAEENDCECFLNPYRSVEE